jgi:hypothetical protein
MKANVQNFDKKLIPQLSSSKQKHSWSSLLFSKVPLKDEAKKEIKIQSKEEFKQSIMASPLGRRPLPKIYGRNF